MQKRFEGKVGIVAGGGKGIGKTKRTIDIFFAKDRVGMYSMIDSYDCQLSGISLLVRPLATN